MYDYLAEKLEGRSLSPALIEVYDPDKDELVASFATMEAAERYCASVGDIHVVNYYKAGREWDALRKAAVMLHFAKGGSIEMRYLDDESLEWHLVRDTHDVAWNWEMRDYRILEEN